jgi:cell division protein FtsL
MISLHDAGASGGGTTPATATASALAASMFRVPVARRGAGVGAFVLAIVTAGALAHVGVRLKGLEVAYDLGRERRIATEMEEQRRRLQIEIGMLKDPRRVIAIAREKLNMGPPAPDAIWRLGSGRGDRAAALLSPTPSAPAREGGKGGR